MSGHFSSTILSRSIHLRFVVTAKQLNRAEFESILHRERNVMANLFELSH